MARVRPSARERLTIQKRIDEMQDKIDRLPPRERAKVQPRLDKIQAALDDPVGFDFMTLITMIMTLLPIILDLFKKK